MANSMLMTAPDHWNGTPVTYDATGVGYMGNYNTIRTFSHTATAGAYVLLAFDNDRSTFIPSNVQYAGAQMTQLGFVNSNNSSLYGVLVLYGIANVPGGASTVSIAGTVGGGWAVANTFSYCNVGTVGALQMNYGQSVAPVSGLISRGSGEMIVNALGMGQINGNVAMSTPTGGTNRYLLNATFGGSALSVSDSNAPATFGAVISGVLSWSSISLVLKP